MTNQTCPCINHPTQYSHLQGTVDSLTQLLDQLHSDVLFIKGFFLAKQAKKEKRRQRKEQQRLEAEQEKRAQKDRAVYEDIVRTVINHPWELAPGPACKLSPKELELVSLMTLCKSDQEIASKMGLKEGSIAARICAANRKLGLKSREELVAYYLNYRKEYRTCRWRGCLWTLRWLLNPPPGRIYLDNFNSRWQRRLGSGHEFRYAGPYIPMKVFASLREYEHQVLRLLVRGLPDAEIAERLGIKKTTVRSHLAEVRSSIKWKSGAKTTSDENLVAAYKKYLKAARQNPRQ